MNETTIHHRAISRSPVMYRWVYLHLSWENWIDIKYTTNQLWCLWKHILSTTHNLQLTQHITGTNHTAQPLWMQHKVWEWRHISLLITSTYASHSTIIVNPTQGAGMRTPALINNFTIWTVTHHNHPGCNIRCRDQQLSVFTICTITHYSHLCSVLPLSWWVWLCTRLTCFPRGPTKLSGATFALQIVSLEELT